MFKPLVKLIKALSSNTDPGAIAHAFACGILLGFVPKDNLLWYILLVFILFMRIQRAGYVLALAVGSLLAPLLDPLFDSIGYFVLTQNNAVPFYISLLNTPFVAFTKFNNTIVMGSLCSGIVIYIPLYYLMRLVIFLWRKYLAEGVRRLKLVKLLKQIPLIEKIASMAGGK